MNLQKTIRIALRIVCLSILFLNIGLASSVNAPSAYGNPLDPSVLESLGLSDAFLFTQNTMYDYRGYLELELLLAEIDPAEITSVSGLPTQTLRILFPDDFAGGASALPANSSLVTTTPEPVSFGLAALACLCLGGLIVRSKLRSGAARAPADLQDPVARRVDSSGARPLWLPRKIDYSDCSEESSVSAGSKSMQTSEIHRC